MLAFWKSRQDVKWHEQRQWMGLSEEKGICEMYISSSPSCCTAVWRPTQHRPKVDMHNSSRRSFTTWLTCFSKLSWLNLALTDWRADSSVKHEVTHPLLYSLPSTLCLNAWLTHEGSVGSWNMHEKHVPNGGELRDSDVHFRTAICRGFCKMGKVQQDRQK